MTTTDDDRLRAVAEVRADLRRALDVLDAEADRGAAGWSPAARVVWSRERDRIAESMSEIGALAEILGEALGRPPH